MPSRMRRSGAGVVRWFRLRGRRRLFYICSFAGVSVPAGTLVAALGLAFSSVLALRMKQLELVVLAGTLVCGLVHWIWITRSAR